MPDLAACSYATSIEVKNFLIVSGFLPRNEEAILSYPSLLPETTDDLFNSGKRPSIALP